MQRRKTIFRKKSPSDLSAGRKPSDEAVSLIFFAVVRKLRFLRISTDGYEKVRRTPPPRLSCHRDDLRQSGVHAAPYISVHIRTYPYSLENFFRSPLDFSPEGITVSRDLSWISLAPGNWTPNAANQLFAFSIFSIYLNAAASLKPSHIPRSLRNFFRPPLDFFTACGMVQAVDGEKPAAWCCATASTASVSGLGGGPL